MRKEIVFVLVFVILFGSLVSAQLNESLNTSLDAIGVKDKTNEVLAKEIQIPENLFAWQVYEPESDKEERSNRRG